MKSISPAMSYKNALRKCNLMPKIKYIFGDGEFEPKHFTDMQKSKLIVGVKVTQLDNLTPKQLIKISDLMTNDGYYISGTRARERLSMGVPTNYSGMRVYIRKLDGSAF